MQIETLHLLEELSSEAHTSARYSALSAIIKEAVYESINISLNKQSNKSHEVDISNISLLTHCFISLYRVSEYSIGYWKSSISILHRTTHALERWWTIYFSTLVQLHVTALTYHWSNFYHQICGYHFSNSVVSIFIGVQFLKFCM